MTGYIGFAIVIVCVFGAFALGGGNLVAIFAPWHEFIIIAGAALGGLIVKTSPRTMKLVLKKAKGVFTDKLPSQETYLQALKLIHDLTFLSRRDGLIALERHVQEPSTSPIFTKQPEILARPALIQFITDNLKIVVIGGVSVSDLELLMETDIETREEEIAAPQMLLSNTADALPGLGIVAAVMGVIKCMASISEGPEVVGERVAGALVGTFLGVLLSYGFVGPMATNVEMSNQEEIRMMQVLKAGIVSIARGLNPKLCSEYARRAIYEAQRPSFEELEVALKA